MAYNVTGEIVAIDKDGARKALDDDDNVRWFWYSTFRKFPEPPRLPDDPQAAEMARKARANIEASKQHDFKVTVDPDGSVIMTLDTGERVRLESA